MSLIADLRIATRSLARTPGFTALSTLVLALGLAIVVVMFAILWEVSYEPPPLPDHETLVGVKTIDRRENDVDEAATGHDFEEWRRSQTVFSAMAGIYDGTVTISGEGPAERYGGAFVTGEYFNVIGVAPTLGRGIEPRDALPGAAPVAVLGYDLWRTRFNSDRSVLGRSMKINGQLATIVGIMPQGFAYPPGAQLFVPVHEPYTLGTRGDPELYMDVFARLKPGVSLDEAAAQMTLIGSRLARQYPQSNAGIEPDVMPVALATTGRDDQQLFQMLFGSVFLVLIIACVNVSGLMLVRATGRTQEAGIRRAIGAGRWRLMSQMLAEALVIGALAALLGLTIAAASLEAMSLVLPSKIEALPAWWDFSIDGRIATFCIVLAILSTLAAGLFPALRVSGLDVNAILREGSRDTGLSTGRIVRWLVVVEIALSCALLTTTGLIVRGAMFSVDGDVGADVRPFMLGRVGLMGDRYGEEEQIRFVERLLPAASAIPGASAATLISAPPAWGAGMENFILPGRSYAGQADFEQAHSVTTSPGFFSTFRVGLLKGRDFTMLDRKGSEPVVIVSQSFANRYFPDKNAIGQRLQLRPSSPDSPWYTIVGVAANVLHDDEPFAAGRPQPTIYVPMLQRPERFFSVVLRTEGDPHALGDSIRSLVAAQDADLPVYFMETLPQYRARNNGGLQILGGLFMSFGLVTVILAAAGIYGVLAYSVAQSAREIAIRRALGAPDRGIVNAVARRSGWQLAIGFALGVVLAPAMAQLFGTFTGGADTAHDVRIYTTVLIVLTLAIVAATALPLRRALQLQPSASLRHS
ncbi:MAG TPA: ABC transporter permease [Steroidobacteraceae bacterium]|nr:ABC transporter permease [Steroidobacteraceae bacterium]